MSLNKYDALSTLRQTLETDNDFTHALDTPANEAVLTAFAHLLNMDVKDLKEDLQKYFNEEGIKDLDHDKEYKDYLVREEQKTFMSSGD